MKKFVSVKVRISYLFGSEYLIVVDEKNRIFYFDDAFRLVKSFKLNLKENNRPYENSVAISNSSEYLLVAINNNLMLFDLKERKKIASFSHEKDILSVTFSQDEKYFAAGDINGEIYVYNTNLRKKVYKLKKHRDFIEDLAFYEDKSYIVAGGYDNCVIFHNLITLEKTDRYFHLKPVRKIEKLNYLVSADERSMVINWDALKKEIKDTNKFFKSFKDFVFFKNYLIIGMEKTIAIYNLDTFIIENDNFLQLDDLDKLGIFKNYLIVTTLNGDLYYRNLFEEENEFLEFILQENYKKAFELIDKNPFLKYSKGFEKLNKIIELEIKKAKKLFLVNEAEALEILNKFYVIPQLREKISKIINEYRNYKKFVFAIKEQNYALAYMLIQKYPMLKETKYYKLLEKKWQIAFEKAKEFALNGNIEKAKEILNPFMLVEEKKALIDLLLKESKLFLLLKEKLAKRDFKGFFAIIKTHPELKDTPEYMKVINYANTLYKLANKFILDEEFKKAKKAALILEDIEGFEDKAQEILKKVEISLKFLQFISQKEYKKAILLSEKYSFLRELPSYKDLIKKHNDIYEKIEKLIHQGQKNKALELLNKEGISDRFNIQS